MISDAQLKNLVVAALAPVVFSACSSGPFSYAEDRCVGGYNQCQTSCTRIDEGGARSACMSRCLAAEDRCYTTGDEGTGSSLAQESLVGYARSEKEKQRDYERWRAEHAKERAATGESDVEIKVIE